MFRKGIDTKRKIEYLEKKLVKSRCCPIWRCVVVHRITNGNCTCPLADRIPPCSAVRLLGTLDHLQQILIQHILQIFLFAAGKAGFAVTRFCADCGKIFQIHFPPGELRAAAGIK